MHNTPETAPEDEVLEGVIVEDGDPSGREATIEDADEIQRVATEARSFNPNNLEEVTHNLDNLKNLLGRFM